MFKKLYIQLCFLFNSLYRWSPRVYAQIYFWYKTVSERGSVQRYACLIKPGFCVYDVGANIGFYARVFSELVSFEGKVIAFEPDPENFRRLQGNTRTLENVTAVNLALGEHSEAREFFRSKKLNVDHKLYPDIHSGEKITVSCRSLDDFVRQGHSQPDLIKLDTQGFEPFILRGMANLLQEGRVLLVFEYWPYAYRKLGLDYFAPMTVLRSFGYAVYGFSASPPWLKERKENFELSLNLLACRDLHQIPENLRSQLKPATFDLV
jgi:FkbM family methyltransferase